MRSRGGRVGATFARAQVALLVGLLTAALPGGAEAQEIGTDCTLEEWISIRSSTAGTGRRITWVGRPLLVCPDGTRLRSDSAVVYEETDRAELIGRVRYETADRLLESQYADYYDGAGRLFARGQVVFTDLLRGTELRGDTLVRLDPRGPGTEEEVTVRGGRPSALLPPPAGEREGAPPPASYEVVGDVLRFEGERFFWADGQVEVVREGMRAAADSLAFDQEAGQLFLNGNARVESETGTMEGERIRMAIPGDVLESITIVGRGSLRTEEVEVVGEEIRVQLRDEKIQRLVAVDRGEEREDEGPEDRPRPRAVTEDFVLRGDSIEVRSPDEVLQSVHAAGRARGESRGRGEPVAVIPAPEEPAEQEEALGMLPGLTDSDWIEGDEITALFEPADAAEPAEQEEGRPAFRLQRLEAKGNARTLYRSPPENEVEDAQDEARRWAISYVVAREIVIHMLDGEVERLEARDQVKGIQLEPEPRTARPGDTARQDG